MKSSGTSVLQHRTLQRSLDRISSRVPDAAQKLWFIKRTLESFEQTPPALRRTPVARSILFHFVALETLGELVFGRRGRVRFPMLPLWGLYRFRHAALVVVVLGLASGAVRAGAYGYGLARSGTDWIFEQLAPPPDSSADLGAAGSGENRIGAPPKEVWLVTREPQEELWSNGLRVVTTFETEGEPRQYFAFPRDGSPPVPQGPRPIGIIYHASESDMAPFGAAFNRDILATTRDLLGWLSRRRIYNYMIDRFGQVYRIVSDETVAIHAGVSIWGDEKHYYLNLNESFIGIAFESQWSAGQGESITTAQIQAALNLTDLLRARYDIADANCVPHGLVSVNSGKRLIGYHADWARNFPFGALGLADKYQIASPAVAAFGFEHDDDLVARLGGSLWPGVDLAERDLDRRAAVEGVELSALRARLQRRYFENVEITRLVRESRGTSR